MVRRLTLDDFRLDWFGMVVEHWDDDAELFDALSSENRLKTFYFLSDGVPPQEIVDRLGVTRSALQPYINDFKEAGLLVSRGKDYELTEKGERMVEVVEQVDKLHADLSELQEFLIENPDVIPEEVKEQIRQGTDEE